MKSLLILGILVASLSTLAQAADAPRAIECKIDRVVGPGGLEDSLLITTNPPAMTLLTHTFDQDGSIRAVEMAYTDQDHVCGDSYTPGLSACSVSVEWHPETVTWSYTYHCDHSSFHMYRATGSLTVQAGSAGVFECKNEYDAVMIPVWYQHMPLLNCQPRY